MMRDHTSSSADCIQVEGVVDYLGKSMEATIKFAEIQDGIIPHAHEDSRLRQMSAAATPDAAASAVGYFAANVCTTAEAAAPIARRSDIAHASARLLMLCNKAAFYDASLHLVEFMRNITFYDRVSVLPDFDNPEAGGSAFLSLAPEVILRPVIPMMLSPAPDTAAAAAGAVGNLMRIPRAREYACNSCADEGLVLLLGSQNSCVVKAAAGALINLACDCSGCVKLADLSVGTAVAEALVNGLGRAKVELDAYTDLYKGRVRPAKRREILADGLKDCEELLQLLCSLLKWHIGTDRSKRGQDSRSGEPGADCADTAASSCDTGVCRGGGMDETACGDVSAHVPTSTHTAEEYDLGEPFWQEASTVLHWLEIFISLIDEWEPGGEVLHKAREALAGLMEDIDDEGEVGSDETGQGPTGKLTHRSQKGVSSSTAPAKTCTARSISS